MRRRIAAVILATLTLAPAAHAAPTLGLYGDPARFNNLTGQHSAAKHVFLAWNSTALRLQRVFDQYAPVPLVAFQTWTDSTREAITPRGIAKGRGDRFLIRLNAAFHAFGKPAYLRPLPEMNGHWNPYCAYNTNGTKRGPAHAQRWFRRAFRRIAVITRGGTRADMNAVLARYHLPGVSRDLPTNPQMRIVWNPQGFGSPDLPGNMPAAYWPGKAFVDVVGNDLYDMHGRVTWEANLKLYRQYPSEGYAFPEWGLWGIDDPSFIRDMRRFVVNHKRVELLAWFNGRKPGNTFDLKTKPASLRVYRRLITPLG